jgi:hypothetical protein
MFQVVFSVQFFLRPLYCSKISSSVSSNIIVRTSTMLAFLMMQFQNTRKWRGLKLWYSQAVARKFIKFSKVSRLEQIYGLIKIIITKGYFSYQVSLKSRVGLYYFFIIIVCFMYDSVWLRFVLEFREFLTNVFAEKWTGRVGPTTACSFLWFKFPILLSLGTCRIYCLCFTNQWSVGHASTKQSGIEMICSTPGNSQLVRRSLFTHAAYHIQDRRTHWELSFIIWRP